MNTDITIVGAGPTGLCLAYALAEAGLSVVLLEKQNKQQLEQTSFDGREIALTHESRRLMESWGLWQHLPAEEISELRQAQVLDGSAQQSMLVQPSPSKASQLGWFVPNHLIRLAAYQQVKHHSGIQLLDGIQISHTSSNAQQAEVVLSDGRTIHSQLLIAADTRFSETRRTMGIPAHMRDYGKSMMVFRVQHEVPHEHIALEWFGYGQTRALLPLNGHCASVVLTLPHSQMQALQRLDDQAFNEDISQRFEHRLGRMQRTTERMVYPLVGVYAARFHARRFALIGDAAVGMHPVTAHGFNLGISSVKHLSERLIQANRAGQDIASPKLLESYTWAHRRSSLPLYTATNLVVSLYTNDHKPARLLRRAVLQTADALQPFKRLIAAQLTG